MASIMNTTSVLVDNTATETTQFFTSSGLQQVCQYHPSMLSHSRHLDMCTFSTCFYHAQSSHIVVIPAWFKFVHCVIFVAVLILPYFIYQILKNVFKPSAGVQHSGGKGIHLQYSVVTKYFLFFSILLSYSYVMTTSSQSILMWINLHAPYALAPSLWCPFLASFRMFSYVAGRVLLYCYFIYRSNDIFAGTYLEFSKCSKYSLLAYILLIVLILVAPITYIYFGMQSWRITTDEDGHGAYCTSDDEGADLVTYIFMFGSLNDMTYSFITIFMMVSRIFLLLTDNERKKSKTQRYERNNSSRGSQQGDHGIADTQQVPAQSPPDSPRRAISMGFDEIETVQDEVADQPPSHHVQLSLDPAMLTQTASDGNLVDNPSADSPMAESPAASPAASPRSLTRSKSKRVTVSKMDAIVFHDKTHGHNKLILLISKFFIILSCVVISSQLTLFLFVAFRDFVLILYSLDTLCNIICLWLSFNFSDEYYNQYCCGRCCTKCCFPYIKSISLTCSEYEIEYQQTHDMSKTCINSKCCIYCRCCCFSSCRYGCCTDNVAPQEIYKLAQYEIELIVASTNNEKSKSKSLTMSKLNSTHSQKDVMNSQLEKELSRAGGSKGSHNNNNKEPESYKD